VSVAQAQARFACVPFATWLGMTLVDTAPAQAVLALPFQPAHANASGPLNGGASASLLLMAGMVAVRTDIDLDTKPHLSCVDMSMHSLAPAREEDVLAEAQMVPRGRDLFFLTVTLRTPADKPICQGVMTYRAPDYAGHTPRLHTHPALLPAPEPVIPPDNPRILRGYVQKLRMAFHHQSPSHTRLYMPCMLCTWTNADTCTPVLWRPLRIWPARLPLGRSCHAARGHLGQRLACTSVILALQRAPWWLMHTSCSVLKSCFSVQSTSLTPRLGSSSLSAR
jgi:uncharacterized protein (TIGR00369 family)